MLWLQIGVGLVLLIVLCFVTMSVLGRRLPEEHVASLTLRLNQPQKLVWETIADVAGHRNWAKGVTKLDRLPDHDNHEVWRQHMGRNSFVLETTVCQPPQRLVMTIADDHQFFSGDWEYELSPDGAGTRVKLTEHGRVHSPVPRAMMHYMFGQTGHIKKHLTSLAEKFGETPRIEGYVS